MANMSQYKARMGPKEMAIFVVTLISTNACAQQGVVDPVTADRLRLHGLLIEDSLAQRYPDPATPQAVRALIIEEATDPETVDYLQNFSAPYADSSASTLLVLEDLEVLLDTLVSYGWIAPAVFADRLSSHIEEAKIAFNSGNYYDADNILRQFREEVRNAVDSSNPSVNMVTKEAGRFLWGYTSSILYRF